MLDQYDTYYLDRNHALPLPVLYFRVKDTYGSRFYVDPRTGQIVGGYSSEGWSERWLYHALHSVNFPLLYNYRPAWDIVVLFLMLGGATVSITAVIIGWKFLAGESPAARGRAANGAGLIFVRNSALGGLSDRKQDDGEWRQDGLSKEELIRNLAADGPAVSRLARAFTNSGSRPGRSVSGDSHRARGRRCRDSAGMLGAYVLFRIANNRAIDWLARRRHKSEAGLRISNGRRPDRPRRQR